MAWAYKNTIKQIMKMTQNVTVYYNLDSDFAKLQKEEKRLQGKLHREAWLHRLRGESEQMLVKIKQAQRALQRERCYAYLQRTLA